MRQQGQPAAKWEVAGGKELRAELALATRRDAGPARSDGEEIQLSWPEGWGSCKRKGLKGSPGPWKGSKKR